jgi:S-adenosyl-L-methionine hydrolase (adenosine-forming)
VAGPFISFLTDFGDNTAPAVCRGVIWSILPTARINDLSHAGRAFGIRDAAFLLWSAIPYLPVGVHLAVVDPGVGTKRRPLALLSGRGDRFVGPDNGLLVPAAERVGGIVVAHALENRELWRDAVSHTFHGRDIFAPVAAYLAGGTAIEEVGPAIDRADLVSLTFPEARLRDRGLDSSVLFVDAFGNCRLAGQPDDLAALRDGSLAPGDRFRVRVGTEWHEVPWHATFGAVPVGEVILYEDADYAGLAIAVNQGSAAGRLGLAHDSPIRIELA